jgi:hypothetical protein
MLNRYGVNDDQIVVINDWRTTGAGYNTDAEHELAAAIHERIRDQRINQYDRETAA